MRVPHGYAGQSCRKCRKGTARAYPGAYLGFRASGSVRRSRLDSLRPGRHHFRMQPELGVRVHLRDVDTLDDIADVSVPGPVDAEQQATGQLRDLLEYETTGIGVLLERFAPGEFSRAVATWDEPALTLVPEDD